MLFHVVEAAVPQDRRPKRLFDLDPEEARDSADLRLRIAFQIVEMDEQDVRPAPIGPPGPDIGPERPDGIPVAIQPIVKELARVGDGRLEWRTHASWSVVDEAQGVWSEMTVVIVPAPQCVAAVSPDVQILCM